MIVLNYPGITLNQEEIDALNAFLGRGGRIFMQFENPKSNSSRKDVITKGQKIAESLHAEFEIDDNQWVAGEAKIEVNQDSKLTKGLSNHTSGMAAYIHSSSDSVTWLFKGTTTSNQTSFVLCDQNAGEKNGEKWGSLTICGDGVYFDDQTLSNTRLNLGKTVIQNLADDARRNRLIAATGINPNKQFVAQATTTTTTTATTDYLTPYAALQKAVEGTTVTLLTKSREADGGLTPTRDELRGR